MTIIRTKDDVLRAYRVYKSMDIFKKYVNIDDANICTLIGTFVALYNGLSMQELEILFPVSKSCIKEVVKKGIYKYGVFDYDKDLVLGRESLTGKLSKGIITLSDNLYLKILENTKSIKVNALRFSAFSVLLSNTSSHVHIMQDNIKSERPDYTSKFILSHMHALFTSLVNQNLYSGSTYAQNLTKLGYMRSANGDVELNKKAILFNKEPRFELRTV